MSIAFQIYFRLHHYECPRKPRKMGIQWDTASGLYQGCRFIGQEHKYFKKTLRDLFYMLLKGSLELGN
jgi:hypothetical protein